jgi:hypothetical protein
VTNRCLQAAENCLQLFDGVNLVTSAVVDSPELYQINPATGVATPVGPTALGLDAVAFENGSLYGFAFGYGGPNPVLSLNLGEWQHYSRD